MSTRAPQMPSLSIVVNNFNYARYLPQALDSALTQIASADEVIVVDDGSNDESASVLAQYAQAHGVKVITQENQGQLSAVCNGIGAATGDIIILLDSDDYLQDGYLVRLRDLYSENPQTSYIFSAAICTGEDAAAVAHTRKNLARMEFPQGAIGNTRCATLMFQEYVGIPTSGNSMRRALAAEILQLASAAEERVHLSSGIARALKISTTEASRPGYSADGVIVRCASILNAEKYYDDRPGFAYRIHGDNKYASTSALGRRYLRRMRNKQFGKLLQKQGYSTHAVTARELRGEIQQRVFGRALSRRVVIRSQYCKAILGSNGSVRDKLLGLLSAMGIAN